MVLIQSRSNTLPDDITRLIHFYRQNPIIAANHLLVRDGRPVTLLPVQGKILMDWWQSKFNQLTASRGFGKATVNGSKVLTVNGWVKIEDIKIGDQVITPKGSLSNVIGIFPQGKQDIYKVNFYDGRTCECTKEHLWTVRGVNGSGQYEVLETEDIKEYIGSGKAKRNHRYPRIPVAENVVLEVDKELYIHPYLLGALVGDGCMTHHVGFTSADGFILEKVSKALPEDLELSKRGKYDYVIVHKKLRNLGRVHINTLKEELKRLNIFGKKSQDKSIPEAYMNLSRKQTIELIQGLIDTDRTTVKGGSITYTTTSKELATQVQTLIWKLGGICTIQARVTKYTDKYGDKVKGRKSYRLGIRYKDKRELVSSPRKLERFKETDQYSEKNFGLRIESIEFTGKKDYATCIKIDDPEELYVTDDYIVTHNTFLCAVYLALKMLLYPNSRMGVFGPSYRQSKLIFKEFTKFVDDSPLLAECILKEPTEGNDACKCILKPPATGYQSSYLNALPVGTDGAKIRGLRFSEILIDECVQLPEVILSSVILPMLATSVDPMGRVIELEKLKNEYKESGKNNIQLIENLLSTDNGYIAITSGYYQFNYWWATIQKFWQQMKAGSNKHSLNFVPWNDIPEGFLEQDLIDNAMNNDPSHMFLTEWCAEWIADSAGAFPMALLSACREVDLVPYSERDLNKHKNTKYVFGIDVARDRDSTAIVIMELGFVCKVVHIVEIPGGTASFQDQAKTILDLIFKFSPEEIYMDSGGGGRTLQDLLADPSQLDVGDHLKTKIIEKESSPFMTGKRILTMCNFVSEFIGDANNNTKALLEQGLLKLPQSNNPIEVQSSPDAKGRIKTIDLVQKMIDQIASIIITSSGVKELPRYDLPKNANSSNAARKSNLDKNTKDLYTAFILAGKCAYDRGFKPGEDLSVPTTGIIREINEQSLTSGPDVGMIQQGRLVCTPQEFMQEQRSSGIRRIRNGGVITQKSGRKKRRR